MPQQQVLRWLDGAGWLVLSGGSASAVRAQTIGRAAADGGVAYISFGDSQKADATLADMEDLGAGSGYLVDVLSEDDQTIQTKLAEASIIVVEAGVTADDARSNLLGAAAAGMRQAYEGGAVILAEGMSAAVFGEWVIHDDGLLDGLQWLSHAIVLPQVTQVAQSPFARIALERLPTALAIGISSGSALALGPDGTVETWGERQVTVALGAGFTREFSD